MFAKPINLILVYLVTVFNIALLASPLVAASLPFIELHGGSIEVQNTIYQKLKFAIFALIFLVSFLMLIYLFFDFLFGFSVRTALKGCTRHEKLKDFDFLSEIFDQVKNKFAEKNVKLYVKNSDEVNAYAVSSLGSKAIVLTRGLINHYLVESPNPKHFLYSLRSIMGHEMSHLINKDFLPTFLIITNQKITNFVSTLLGIILSIFVRVVAYIPHLGRTSSRTIADTYSILNFFVTAFNRFIVYNIYELLRRFISRSIEYRCDRQSAVAFGGQNMANALAMLGDGGYFTLFSTHPRTKARIKKVENIRIKDSVVTPRFFDSLANYFSLMFLIIISLYFAKQANVDYAVRQYLENHEAIHHKISALWQMVSRFF